MEPMEPIDKPLADPWNHPEEAFRRLKVMSDLRKLTMELHRAYCRAHGLRTNYELEDIIERREPSFHTLTATGENASGDKAISEKAPRP